MLQGQLTPLHKAAWGGHKEVTKILLDHGSSVDAQDEVSLHMFIN